MPGASSDPTSGLSRSCVAHGAAFRETLRVPSIVVLRSGAKKMRMPDGASSARKADNTLVKALARAFGWKRMLESGEFANIAELAEREGIAHNRCYCFIGPYWPKVFEA